MARTRARRVWDFFHARAFRLGGTSYSAEQQCFLGVITFTSHIDQTPFDLIPFSGVSFQFRSKFPYLTRTALFFSFFFLSRSEDRAFARGYIILRTRRVCPWEECPLIRGRVFSFFVRARGCTRITLNVARLSGGIRRPANYRRYIIVLCARVCALPLPVFSPPLARRSEINVVQREALCGAAARVSLAKLCFIYIAPPAIRCRVLLIETRTSISPLVEIVKHRPCRPYK